MYTGITLSLSPRKAQSLLHQQTSVPESNCFERIVRDTRFLVTDIAGRNEIGKKGKKGVGFALISGNPRKVQTVARVGRNRYCAE